MKSFFERYGHVFLCICTALAGVCLFAFGLYIGTSATASTYQARIIKMEYDQAKALAKSNADAVAKKQQDEQRFYEIDSQHQEALSDAKKAYELDVAAVRAGTDRVRERFTCNGTGSLPSVATGTGGSDATQDGGLRADDAEFLVRFAYRADEVAQSLAACQAVVRADRGEQ